MSRRPPTPKRHPGDVDRQELDAVLGAIRAEHDVPAEVGAIVDAVRGLTDRFDLLELAAALLSVHVGAYTRLRLANVALAQLRIAMANVQPGGDLSGSKSKPTLTRNVANVFLDVANNLPRHIPSGTVLDGMVTAYVTAATSHMDEERAHRAIQVIQDQLRVLDAADDVAEPNDPIGPTRGSA